MEKRKLGELLHSPIASFILIGFKEYLFKMIHQNLSIFSSTTITLKKVIQLTEIR